MPYDAYTADTIHQFFQMYQQMDCAIDREHVSRGNPTGCLHDLQSAITTTFATSPLTTPPQVPRDTGQTMAVFNMQQGDVPLFKSLADQFTMSDNYHQPVMGGTGPDSVPLGFADQVFFSDGSAAGNVATPPASQIYNPEPGGCGLQQRQLQSLHVARPVVQLLRRERARHQADPRLSGAAALRAVAELPGRRLLQRRQRQPGVDAGRHAAGRHHRPAGRPSAASATCSRPRTSRGSIMAAATIRRSRATRSTATATSAIRSSIRPTIRRCGPTTCAT